MLFRIRHPASVSKHAMALAAQHMQPLQPRRDTAAATVTIMANTTVFKSWQVKYTVQWYNDTAYMNTMQSQLRYIRNAYTSHSNPAVKQYILLRSNIWISSSDISVITIRL